MRKFSLSTNIESSVFDASQYIVTPNAQRAVQNIIDDFHAGIHSFTIIGSYGTGKSSFLLALEADLTKKNKLPILVNPDNLTSTESVEVMNIVGDYTELSTLLRNKLGIEGHGKSILDGFRSYCNDLKAQNKFLLIVVDEFGKVLEHAAKNHPEQELYFMQKFAEFVNVSSRRIIFLTTLHQNFSSYAKDLSQEQKNEWVKVKGRFKEVTFVEPIEQILYLASRQIMPNLEEGTEKNIDKLFALAKEMRFVSDAMSNVTARSLYPMDIFSAYTITSAITRYGQNERSLFTFLSSKGDNSLMDFVPQVNKTFNLQHVYDYIVFSFYSYLKDANADSMAWSSMQVSIERVEGLDWANSTQKQNAIAIVKAIGLLNLFAIASSTLTEEQMTKYAQRAMGILDAEIILFRLIQFKIIRFARYKHRLMLFQGTDVDIEAELERASAIVARPIVFIDDLNLFFNKRISPVKAHYYHHGTPRFFDYDILEEPRDIVPTGDTDGYIELIFSSKKDGLKKVMDFSAINDHALIFAFFNNTDEIIDHLYNIQKYDYILNKVLLDKADRVAVSEVTKLKKYEEALLNKAISENLFAYRNRVTWIYKGQKQRVESHRDFNILLSRVCDDVYSETPIMNNELFNKQKLSGSISTARKNYLRALLEHYSEEDLGFEDDKFPPEKTIYFSLLKNTGIHVHGEFADHPSESGIQTLWAASEDFLQSTVNKPRKISEFVKILSSQPYKLKQGFIDFWVPTFLFIKRQDFALYNVSNHAFVPNINMEFFELLQKHSQDFEVKKFAVDGVKLGFFNQYRRFVNLGEEFTITKDRFIETIKPFLAFYARLDDYTKHTRKFDHESTLKFRDVLATAKDPEKAFFEDLPEALGFNKEKLKQEEFIREYGNIIQRAIRELRTCYTGLIDRIEGRLIDDFDLQSSDYNEYVEEIRSRLSHVKTYLLTDKQREFYHHVMTEYDNRTLWYQSICYTILEQRLDSLRDEQEEKLVDDLIYLFRACEKYSAISQKAEDVDKNDAYSFDMVTNKGMNVRAQTYILPEKDKVRAAKLEAEINNLLSTSEDNVCVCTLLAILNRRIHQ